MARTAVDAIPRTDLRYRRSMGLAHAIFGKLRDYIPREYERRAMDDLVEILMDKGIEVLTDFDREQMNLPPRGPDGWTTEEIIAIEQRRLDAMLKPIQPVFIARPTPS